MKTIMQGFYWNCIKDVSENSTWYQVVANKVSELKKRGIDIIWLPPPSRGMDKNGMGYDIKEHYNLNSAFGNEKELKQLVEKIKDYDMMPIVDTVMAHMIGGEREYNPYYEDIKYKHAYSYTDFSEEKFPKNYKHFCRKCGDCKKMSSDFGEKICHYADDEYIKNGFIKWGKWLKDEIGFEGFRLDYVKDMKAEFIKEWTAAVGGKFIVGEYWSGDQKELKTWIKQAETKAFNFPLFYALNKMCNKPNQFDMRELANNRMKKTVSFVDNHDTDRDEPVVYDKKLAYAYMLLFTKEATIFWKDYFNYNLKAEIDILLRMRQAIKNPFVVEYVDYDLLVGRQDGYQILINKSKKTQEYKGLEIPARDYFLHKKRIKYTPVKKEVRSK